VNAINDEENRIGSIGEGNTFVLPFIGDLEFVILWIIKVD
jgi:hypothetical protein